MSQFAAPIPNQASSVSLEVIAALENAVDVAPDVSCDTSVSTTVSAIFQNMNPVDRFGAAQFASDECGDSMWNEENLNPPSKSK